MKKVLAAAVLLILLAGCLFAGSISYIYGGSISSVDFEVLPARGTVFTDSQGNVLIVSRTYKDNAFNDKVVVFDRLITRSDYELNSSLKQRSSLKNIGLYGSLGYSLVEFDMTCSLYPLRPAVMVGAAYAGGLGTSALVLAGAKVCVPLSNLWDSSFTLIRNGGLSAWTGLGLCISGSVDFACAYGVSYRHSIGNFCWEAGACGISVAGYEAIWSPCVALGVDF